MIVKEEEQGGCRSEANQVKLDELYLPYSMLLWRSLSSRRHFSADST